MVANRCGEIYKHTVTKRTRISTVWDWRLKDTANHKVVATSGNQRFTERNDAVEAFQREFPGVEYIYVGLPRKGEI